MLLERPQLHLCNAPTRPESRAIAVHAPRAARSGRHDGTGPVWYPVVCGDDEHVGPGVVVLGPHRRRDQAPDLQVPAPDAMNHRIGGSIARPRRSTGRYRAADGAFRSLSASRCSPTGAGHPVRSARSQCGWVERAYRLEAEGASAIRRAARRTATAGRACRRHSRIRAPPTFIRPR